MHLGEYRERVTDVGCEKDGCLARGLLVKIGENVVLECNEPIGIRIMNETEKQRATGLKAETDAERASHDDGTPNAIPTNLSARNIAQSDVGMVVIADDEQNPMSTTGPVRRSDKEMVPTSKTNPRTTHVAAEKDEKSTIPETRYVSKIRH